VIYGIGTDLVQISRLMDQLARNGDRLADKILGTEELQEYQQRRAKVEVRGLRYLATRFAAKEAFSKALGIGMRPPMAWHAMQVLNEANGKPIVVTNGALADFMRDKGLSAQVSLSDEVEYALAFVIIEQTAGQLGELAQ
jgi:holo-[acyl-carrier protein] synthase